MTLPRRLLLSLALLLAFAAPAAAQRPCGTVMPTPEEYQRLLDRMPSTRMTACVGGHVAVAVHVLTNGATGLVTMPQITAQIAELNANFAPWGYTFSLASVDYTNNAAWFSDPSGNETALTNALAIDPAHTLNLYLCDPNGFLGYTYLPDAFPENSKYNAVYVHYATLPGGWFTPYDLGRTATHEIGHYFGLWHTFDNGCSPGDFVDDTPAEASAAGGCPIGRDTCPAPGVDPIHNYMDYTDDACYTEFSPGQAARMCAMLATYRPSLLTSGPVPARPSTWGRLKLSYR
ncbi:MAG: zinc metalloprotease [Candidatus Eisenbacteria bacterium]